MKLYQSLAIISSIGLSTTVHAGFFPNQWKDSDEGILQVGIEGQYFYQSNNVVVAHEVIPGGDTATFDLLRAPNVDKEWGYRAMLGYIFPEHNYDIRASYWDVRADNNLNSTQPGSFLIFESSQQSNYDFKAAEITFGQYFNPTCCLALRAGYGIAYADIKQKSKAAVDVFVQGTKIANGTNSFENSFKGIGPKLGLDAVLDMNKSFFLVGGLGINVLFGESEANYRISEGTPPPKKEDNKAIFETDAKLGASYTTALNDDFAFDIEAGYRGAYYFDALQKQNAEFKVSGAILDVHNDNDDYYNYGPYVSVTVDFM